MKLLPCKYCGASPTLKIIKGSKKQWMTLMRQNGKTPPTPVLRGFCKFYAIFHRCKENLIIWEHETKNVIITEWNKNYGQQEVEI